MCDPILVTLWKMRPHPAVHPHWPLIRKYPARACNRAGSPAQGTRADKGDRSWCVGKHDILTSYCEQPLAYLNAPL